MPYDMAPPAGFEPASTGLKDRGPVPLDEGGFVLERAAGIEPATDGLEDRGSASELYPRESMIPKSGNRFSEKIMLRLKWRRVQESNLPDPKVSTR